jgi:pyrimidine-nucleoside phosphorylase
MSDEVTDYQMSAWLMAAFVRGLSTAEMLELTDAMLHSGRVLEHRAVDVPKVDKHSTGGVGDKISICLAPLVAACGVAVPMVSGRGLGHTGGTLDKLEAIPGFNVRLSTRRFEQQVKRLGVAMIGQTPELAPADRKLYALRDVTGTVECIELIVASILSKKLAEGIDALVLDVKVGRGAFMKDSETATQLARALIRVGKRGKKRVRALLTDMNVPLGLSIGNALETCEALEVLHGIGPQDVRDLTFELGVEMLLSAGHSARRADALAALEKALSSGAALELMARMVRAQGGDSRCVERPELLPRARSPVPVKASKSGVVSDIDPYSLAMVALSLGAGRTRVDQAVDPKAGIRLSVRPGDRVHKGDILCELHAARPSQAQAEVDKARRAFGIGSRHRPTPLVLARLR